MQRYTLAFGELKQFVMEYRVIQNLGGKRFWIDYERDTILLSCIEGHGEDYNGVPLNQFAKYARGEESSKLRRLALCGVWRGMGGSASTSPENLPLYMYPHGH